MVGKLKLDLPKAVVITVTDKTDSSKRQRKSHNGSLYHFITLLMGSFDFYGTQNF